MAEARDAFRGGAAGDERGGAGGAQEAVGGEVVGVGVSGALAGEDADAAADADALAGGLDQRLVDAKRGGGDGLEVEVCVLAAGRERFAQATLHQALGEAELFNEVALVVGRWDGSFLGLRQGHSSILGFYRGQRQIKCEEKGADVIKLRALHSERRCGSVRLESIENLLDNINLHR